MEKWNKNRRDWIHLFQWFHAHPETGFQEKETTAKIRQVLTEEGIEILPPPLETGIIAVIRGGYPGKSVCLRADIDALPIEEQTNLSYASQNKGKMHACGHDFHIVSVLEAASKLQAERKRLYGTIYLVFQPAEEIINGAEKIIETGLLEGVTEVYGLHTDPALKVGTLGIQDGAIMAAVNRFQIHIQGEGTHAAYPQLGRNPIPVLAQIISTLNHLAAGQSSSYYGSPLSPLYPRVITVTQVTAGNSWNIIPETAYLQGTVRTLNQNDREQIQENLYNLVDQIGQMSGTNCLLDWYDGPSAIINDSILCDVARETASSLGLTAVSLTPAMIGDDFSSYLSLSPTTKGLYVKVGTGEGFPLHHPAFQVDATAIENTAIFLATLIIKRTLGS